MHPHPDGGTGTRAAPQDHAERVPGLPTPPVGVAVVATSTVVDLGLRAMIGGHDGLLLLGLEETGSALATVVLCEVVTPADRRSPPGLRSLCRRHPVVAVLAAGQPPEGELGTSVRRLGARACVSLAVTGTDLLETIEHVARRSSTGRLDLVLAAPGERPGLGRDLTVREEQVLLRIARGASNQEIADDLFLSINSVKTYIKTAYRKMGVTTRSQAVAWVLRRTGGGATLR